MRTMARIQIPKIPSSEITPEHVYLNRRSLMKGAGLALGAAALAACRMPEMEEVAGSGETESADQPETTLAEAGTTDELGDPLNTFDQITNYNNYYEFSTDKQAVARLAEGYPTSPWTVEVGGLVNNPGTYDVDDLRKMFDIEERIYRLRCVEAWSMVIPWMGFPISDLLAVVEPKSEAQYLRFETILDPEGMPGQRNSSFYEWPYVEGLRVDEAMNPLAILGTGLYGKDLLPQNGAPIRLVVPWKYGFKSIKSIVKIELVTEQPTSLWMAAAGHEYGFYANVNPTVNHPRWSQATERRIGERGRRETLMFNGYEEQVAYLYEGLDLVVNY
ncbi:MAG: protein-methionine-sulfoxide reductase catalytic subunit MsrP [Caldilineaceae bacterium]|nr:protein-methionine-sulfoxide reductase catalytic subunit MsrP [Caldilineaceae bacterium]MDE0069514.1 protein-methionine-sulfoxide reductase catalytic subunit MsrP [Caldilineaceae bacterium]MDE0182292.1 protein-methionine-sulfoxide reductase catalytic subunit MsrP [Caldilineaceae bacterium]